MFVVIWISNQYIQILLDFTVPKPAQNISSNALSDLNKMGRLQFLPYTGSHNILGLKIPQAVS